MWKAPGTPENQSVIVFLPTGEMERVINITFIDETLAPTINAMTSQALANGVKDLDFWRLINWMFVVHYWCILLDFSQLNPTIFAVNGSSSAYIINVPPNQLPPTNNIFVNSTLFQIYSEYLYDTILPFYGFSQSRFPPMAPLAPENKMNTSSITLTVLYTCTDLALKSGLNLVIAVLVADWAFIFDVPYSRRPFRKVAGHTMEGRW